MAQDARAAKKLKTADQADGSSVPGVSADGKAAGAPSIVQDSPFKVPGAVVTGKRVQVPLDYSGKVPGSITVFVRHLVAPVHVGKRLPFLMYFAGGPGFEGPRVMDANGGWIKKALEQFQVLLLDQRGTGLSTPVTVHNLQRRGTPQQQAQYLSYFRADSIVRDAEVVRQLLVPPDNHQGRMSLLGQSFGGFISWTYLSLYPQALIEVLTTVYTALAPRVLELNRRYYQRYPADAALVRSIVLFLAGQPEGGVRLPDGSLLTPRLLQTLGLSGLGSGGGFDRLHYLLESFFDGGEELHPAFIKGFTGWHSWDTNPLYALLHESIYCQGAASGWAAQAARDSASVATQFDAVAAAKAGHNVMFTGECVFPWLFEDVACLRPYQEAAHLLASKADWPTLYCPEVLAKNKVPVASAVYLEDMYVDYHLSQATVRVTGGDVRQWVTNELKHSGIRDDGARVFERLLSMARDTLLLE